MAYLAKEPNSWAAASWTVGLSSALLLGTTNYAALYYLLRSNLFLIPQRAAGVAQRGRSGRAFPKRKVAWQFQTRASTPQPEENSSSSGREMT